MKSNFLIMKLSEFIQKEKVLNALTSKELKEELLLLNILVKFINHGDGIKDRILSNKF
jgi:hypothetical protein